VYVRCLVLAALRTLSMRAAPETWIYKQICQATDPRTVRQGSLLPCEAGRALTLLHLLNVPSCRWLHTKAITHRPAATLANSR
jgi:hypothetical protein